MWVDIDHRTKLHATPQRTIQLKYCKFEIWGDNASNGWVATALPDGRTCIATRQDTQQNRNEAEMEGYDATADGVWRALVEHELLHNLVAEYLCDRESVVVKTESGGGIEPLWDRYYEEAIVLATQSFLNTDVMPDVLREIVQTNPIREKWFNLLCQSFWRLCLWSV